MSKKKIDLKRNWVDDADRFEDEEEEFKAPEKKWTTDELFELVQLGNLKKTSNMNLVDRGFPRLYGSLALKGYTKKVGDGHQITEEGRAYVEQWHHILRKQ